LSETYECDRLPASKADANSERAHEAGCVRLGRRFAPY